MRNQFAEAIVERSANHDMVFLTGDLGFMALESVQEALGSRFVNAGVAEQNMISVAAGLSYTGLDVWAYSIAPFCYARPFEQIRNDIALHNLPVTLVGNGGGYGYGVMGPTHHAIEDYGVLCTLPNMKVCVPVFDEDLGGAVQWIKSDKSPSYLRLGRGEKPDGYTPPAFAPWRQLCAGQGPVIVAVGPLAGGYLDRVQNLPEHERPNLWAACVLPIKRALPPRVFVEQLGASTKLIVAEEHVQTGGFGADLLMWLTSEHIGVQDFVHMFAQSHSYDAYGSQTYLRQKSGLDAQTLMQHLTDT
ncbi:transketolase family protein [Planktotalea arctica]|uniref:transketolase family protein n=1 Tax=Planktotalea arctica TaxID=1481893 RepID=UPI000A17184C|nr:transketolase [Planktotalea arctica]